MRQNNLSIIVLDLMMTSTNSCPHCDKDRRNVDELVYDLKEIDTSMKLDKDLVMDSFDELKENLVALLKHPKMKGDILSKQKIEEFIESIDGHHEQIEEYESEISKSEDPDDEISELDVSISRTDLMDSQESIQKLLSELVNEIEVDTSRFFWK